MSKLTLSQLQAIEDALTNVGLGIISVDKKGEVLFANHAASSLLGLGKEKIPPEEWTKFYGIYLAGGEEIVWDKSSPFSRALDGEELDDLELLIRNRLVPGRTILCNSHLRPLRNDVAKSAEGFVLLLEDITERKKLASEAARSNSALQQFATVAAHDLQEPLRSVAGFTELLEQYQKDKLDERSLRCITKVKDGVLRMQTLINDLLNFSRIQTKPRTLAPLDLNKKVENCIKSLNASIEKSGAKINVEPLPTVTADRSQMAQLFQNLIGNAMKFSAEGRTPNVNISAKQNGPFWKFTIQDNGIGIAPEYTERIFGVFQRLHSGSTYPGTGIGLAICQHIVVGHGGQIWVESEPGAGSTFHFTLPISAEDIH